MQSIKNPVFSCLKGLNCVTITKQYLSGIDLQIALHYGHEKFELRIPDSNVAAVITPRQELADKGQNPFILKNALFADKTAEFEQTISHQRLCVLLPDAMRDLPMEDCLKAIAPKCKSASNVQFILCTGTHTAKTKDNLSLCDKVSNSAKITPSPRPK